MPPNRPSAFATSFPEEVEQDDMHYLVTDSSTSVNALGKRKYEGDERLSDIRAQKRRQLPAGKRYEKKTNEIVESDNLVLSGEEDQRIEENVAQDRRRPNDKPIRELHNFCMFDPNFSNEYVTLEALDQNDGVDRKYEAAGLVMPYFVSDEDEGQEDDDGQDGRRKNGDGEMTHQRVYVHLSTILRYTVDYTQQSEPFFIETQYAWYILRKPSPTYEVHFKHFYLPRRMAQIVVSSALTQPRESFDSFLRRLITMKDMLGESYKEDHIWNSITEIQDVISNEQDARKLLTVPFVQHIMSRAPKRPDNMRLPQSGQPKWAPRNKVLTGNPDIAVLKRENQNQTCVTPRIGQLAMGLIQERIMLLGTPLKPQLKEEQEIKKRTYKALKGLIEKARKDKKVMTHKKDRISVEYDRYKAVEIDGERYEIGDVIVVPNPDAIAKLEKRRVQIDRESKIDDYFWFGRLLYIAAEQGDMHLQWFEHGSQTVMGELAHRQELFLLNVCGDHAIKDIVGKANVYFGLCGEARDHGKLTGPLSYFCKFMHNQAQSSFTSIDIKRLKLFDGQQAPNNCPVCPLMEEQSLESEARELKNDAGIQHGLAFLGLRFHLEDCVLYRAEQGPANIGYITNITFNKRKLATKVKLRKLGRVSQLGDRLPAQIMKDERHLYLTQEIIEVEPKDLLRVVFVPHIDSFHDPENSIMNWLEQSPDHYFVTYEFPGIKIRSWSESRRIQCGKYHVCRPCFEERLSRKEGLKSFIRQAKPLKTMDLFGGVGAFSLGIAAGSKCLKVTHAVEISPSAALTFAHNSPETNMYNLCANEFLRYAVKLHHGHDLEVPKQKFDEKTVIRPPPGKGEIDVITAGFPCQSHSTLNMYKETDDVKSNLILTTLSYLDHWSPKYAYFENVPGFTRYKLRSMEGQPNAHQLKEGTSVDMGGLKLLLRCLIDMNYQVQYCLLQAANYGAPQRRSRFFSVAAKHDEILPDLPQATHHYETKTLDIKAENNKVVSESPIRTTPGTALHPTVTIEDAIGDLPLFDWKHPQLHAQKESVRRQWEKRGETVPSIPCKKSEPFSGFGRPTPYRYAEPKTRYQKEARLRGDTKVIQQYTKCLLPEKVERVLHIPLKPKADYRDLPPHLNAWNFIDPMSSVGRMNYREGIYGRLDPKGVFPTTVTNVDPTAKQSWCLHPTCHRMITVRELARSQGFPDWFEFKAIDNSVVTMHRQIGNAVPLPVARALGQELRNAYFEKWKQEQQEEDIVMMDG
ncbi:S-adenosyl-L-methionine-dependent methyltransferase [Agrocybe pediades]|nr:S-adenosyl-L-methionine-dependent methyltransferase [Agrocybe pediades]